MTEALLRVGDLRAAGRGWGVIAKEVGVNLGAVACQAKQVRQQMRAEAKKEAMAGDVRPGQQVEHGKEPR